MRAQAQLPLKRMGWFEVGFEGSDMLMFSWLGMEFGDGKTLVSFLLLLDSRFDSYNICLSPSRKDISCLYASLMHHVELIPVGAYGSIHVEFVNRYVQ